MSQHIVEPSFLASPVLRVWGRLLAFVLALVLAAGAVASPCAAQPVSGAVASDAMAQAMRTRGLTPLPESGLSLEDHIETWTTGSGEAARRHVGFWIGPDGQIIPNGEWRDVRPDYCKRQARYMHGGIRRFDVEFHSINPDRSKDLPDEYLAFARVQDAETGKYVEQREGEGGSGRSGVAEALEAAWGKMQGPVAKAPDDPCGEVRLKHVSGEQVDDPFVFRAGFRGFGKALVYTWDFGDGSAPAEGRSLQRPEHVYDAEGTYEVSVRVRQQNGETNTATISVDASDEEEENSSFPCAVPSDAPFPEGADLRVTTQEMAGGTACVVAFTFSKDANLVYQNFKRYAIENGYDIKIETGSRFGSTKGEHQLIGLVVEVNDMGPTINVGTATFTDGRN